MCTLLSLELHFSFNFVNLLVSKGQSLNFIDLEYFNTLIDYIVNIISQTPVVKKGLKEWKTHIG